MRRVDVLILAAGLGKRMRSRRIKLLHEVAGRPMVAHVVETARSIRPSRVVAVVGHQADEVREALAGLCDRFALQKEQLGTGHAVRTGAALLRDRGAPTLVILSGDVPAMRASTLRALLGRHRQRGAALTFVSTEVSDPSGYGRVVRDASGRVARIVEERDATAEERKIREINAGIYCAERGPLLSVLGTARRDNAQGEYYLTDAVRRLLARGEKVEAVLHPEPEEVLGVNTRVELARANAAIFARAALALQERGVSVLDPARSWIDPRSRIGRDSVLWPDIVIEGACVLGEGTVVRSGCRLRNVVTGRGVEIKDHCVLDDARLEDGAAVGPFAHLRPGSVLEADTRVGNFVEVKKSRLGRGSKAMHLTYLGDATIGPRCNIGAGTITCNYDGVHKHPTTLEEGVFIGSDTQLVAPVRVGRGAYVAAGTTVTTDVPAGALAVSRTKQANLEGWVERRRRKAASGRR